MPRRLVAALTIALAGPAALGCGSSRPPSAVASAEGLPEYGPEDSALFDDSLAPEVVTPGREAPPAGGDAALAERSRRAELILPARISTVTRDSATARAQPKYQVELRATAAPILGSFEDEALVLDVRTAGATYAALRRSEDALMGRRVIVLARRFASGGDAVVHWHAVADTPATRATIRRIVELHR
ncbi:MAG: hypothetical protein IT376_22640 [Polyangiaceae bacterium]|nr:hypothetical protein [Polyangiaceae bacterium]